MEFKIQPILGVEKTLLGPKHPLNVIKLDNCLVLEPIILQRKLPDKFLNTYFYHQLKLFESKITECDLLILDDKIPHCSLYSMVGILMANNPVLGSFIIDNPELQELTEKSILLSRSSEKTYLPELIIIKDLNNEESTKSEGLDNEEKTVVEIKDSIQMLNTHHISRITFIGFNDSPKELFIILGYCFTTGIKVSWEGMLSSDSAVHSLIQIINTR